MDKPFSLIARTLFTGLLVFELLNLVGLLHYTLSFTWFGLMITLLFVWSVIEIASAYLKKKTGRPLSGLAMMIGTFGVYTDGLGDILKYYDKFIWYDQIAHFIGSLAAGAIIFSVIYNLSQSGKIGLKTTGVSLFSFCAGGVLGVFYELEEYFEDLITDSHRLGDGIDTANDLFLNLIGIIAAIIIANIIIKYVHNRSRANH